MRPVDGTHLLRVSDLKVATAAGGRALVDGVSFDVREGEILGIVGPSGAGKSLTALSVLGLLPRSIRVVGGSIVWQGEELVGASDRRFRDLRRSDVGVVFQEAMSALHPCHRVGRQVEEAVEARGTPRREAREVALALLAEVGIPDPSAWATRFPHQWSGGMRQRALIAMALAGRPHVLIADEPTSSLDVTIQAQVMWVLDRLRRERGLAIILISHDLGLVASHADRLVVLAEGRTVEAGGPVRLLEEPRHEATRALARGWRAWGAARPVAAPPTEGAGEPAAQLLEVRAVAVRAGETLAVRDVSLRIRAGECVALIGESGCGKSTLASALVGLSPLEEGQIRIGGQPLDSPRRADRRRLSDVQLVLQDSTASLNPRRSVAWSVGRPLQIRGVGRREREKRVSELLERVGLQRAHGTRRPAQLSGGERQRAAVARALAVRPGLLVLDEPFSALDAHRRADLAEFLGTLRAALGLSYLIISHDLRAVSTLADRVYVIYLGRVVECGPADLVLTRPAHPYTAALIEAVPRAGQKARPRSVVGEVPDPLHRPAGCPYHPRCVRARPECRESRPELAEAGTGHGDEETLVACFHPLHRD